MVTLPINLLKQTAAELMSSDMVLVPREMSLQGAAHLLAQAQVSGAPVVDEEGRCIGVLSTTDFLHIVEKGKVPVSQSQKPVQSWQIVEDEDSEEIVEKYMNTDPVTVPSGTRIGVIAHMMIDAHIHRVIVVDERGHPIGIVSSTDILAAVAQAAAH